MGTLLSMAVNDKAPGHHTYVSNLIRIKPQQNWEADAATGFVNTSHIPSIHPSHVSWASEDQCLRTDSWLVQTAAKSSLLTCQKAVVRDGDEGVHRSTQVGQC